jgi:hypothetical protein
MLAENSGKTTDDVSRDVERDKILTPSKPWSTAWSTTSSRR